MKTREQVAQMAREAIERREGLLEKLGRAIRIAKDDPSWWSETEELNGVLRVADAQVEVLLGVLEVEEAEMLASLVNEKKEGEKDGH